MTGRIQLQRSNVSLDRPANTRPIGELYINFADQQLVVIDDLPSANDLLPIRWHSPRARYNAGDWVRKDAALYRAKTSLPTKPFDITDWETVADRAYLDAQLALKLSLSGGTMTGPLTLAGDPSAPTQAATKSYVDTALGNYLPLAGGNLSGQLNVGAYGIHYSTFGSSHVHAFGWDGSNVQAFVDGSFVGNLAIGNFLPIAGGTITGNLGVNGTTHVGGTLDTSSNLYVRGGTIFFGTGDTAYLQSDGTNATLRFRSDGWNIRWDGSNGNFLYQSPSQWLFYVDSGGSGHFRNNLDLPGTLTAGAINAPGGTTVVNQINVSNGIVANDTNTNSLTINGDAYSAGFMQIAGGRSMSTSGWAYGTGGSSPVSGTFTFGLQVNNNVMGGAFLANSDARLKTDVTDLTPERGALWVKRSRPVTYRKRYFYGTPDSVAAVPENEGLYEAGFIAQEQIAAGFGEFVVSVPAAGMPAYDHDGVRTPADTQLALNINNQVALLTAAMQHVLARLDAMEDEI